jgi:hypothetical protein
MFTEFVAKRLPRFPKPPTGAFGVFGLETR